MLDFPPFRLDVSNEILWRGDLRVHLRPKAFGVLQYMAERPGHLVTTDELVDAMWPDVAVSGEALTQVIAELRATLGDDARHPLFIQTVYRRGFRFIGGVQPSPGGDRIPVPIARGRGALRESRELPGREVELARLVELLLEARAGRRQMVFVTGEPGIGKTSLIRTFLDGLTDDVKADEPVWIALGHCVETHGEGESYLPVLESLDRLVRDAGAQPVVRCLARFAPSWLAQLPWLLTANEARKISTTGISPTRMLREFCLAMEALSEERTLVLWLDDLHWSDTATIDLLAALAARSDPARLLIVVSYRPVQAAADSHPVAPLKRSLKEQRRCEEISLEPLDQTAVRAMLGLCLAAEPDEALAALIHEQTEGNPLYIVTLIDHLVAEALLVETKAGWKASAPLEALREAVPESLAALVETQLARLNDEELELLQAGSVSGETFAAQAVAAATGWDIQLVEKVGGRLASGERFIESTGPSFWPDGSVGESFRFLHAVFRHIIYRRLPSGLRQRLHHRIGKREGGFGSQSVTIAAELELHFGRGGNSERTLEHLVAAAKRVRQRSGSREAVAYFERALALLGTLPKSVDRGAAISYIGLQSLITSASWVGHTHEVMTNAHHIAKIMVDMETGQRGFMITGNDDFLEPYNAGKRDFDEVLQATIGLVQDNPAQVRRLEVVRQKQREWLRVAGDYEIELRRRVDHGERSEPSLAHVLQGRAEDGQPILGGQKTGKQLMDEIRVVIDEIVAVERDLLEQRKRENESATIFSQNVAVYGSSLRLGE